ncbi:hypothetical protein DR871_013180 [Flavobacterium petrolei]|jgi:hypothetical protein|uniref:Uncharacterized protein n=1 Tax=Flavobacterium petrolei TaxID=2259594 RepID=A0A482TT21_9FLAO|nr:hypothetical protein [Flavobacterium sp. XN-5]OYX86644.1 MAG: hypothetical protein B7Y83_00640 [Flavobacteriales bacterium 32-34-25]RYJ51374.1 hypothetical protein DR871_013180 [Flavobacterium petrolei]
MLVQKKQLRQSKSPAQKINLQKQNIKAVARTSPVKNAKMVTTATAIVSTVLVDAALLHLL